MGPGGAPVRHDYQEISTGYGVPLVEYDSAKANNTVHVVAGGGPMRRYRRHYFRGLVGVLSPILITAFFITVWRIYLGDIDGDAESIVGPPGATYIFYTWFVVGVVGLNLSLYGLLGIEASILLGKNPDARGLSALRLHESGTWNGPRGWGKAIQRLVMKRTREQDDSVLPSAMWFILALPSVLVFVALPLSGLSMETTTGFIRRGEVSSAGPEVTGFSYNDFNERGTADVTEKARVPWANALDARIPGAGRVYTPPGAKSMNDLILPKDDGISDIFLTAQAEIPIEGTAWGLRLQYNCSIVEKLSDLTELRRNESSKLTPSYPGNILSVFDNNPTSIVYNMTGSHAFPESNNLPAIMETGASSWRNESVRQKILQTYLNNPPNTECYFKPLENITGDYPGFDEPSVLEVVLWQYLREPTFVHTDPAYNLTLDHNITELYGLHDGWEPQVNGTKGFPMSAIGARCTSSSNVGTARIDGARSTFSDFQRTDTPMDLTQPKRCAMRFDARSIKTMISEMTPLSINSLPPTWMGDFFKSVAAPPPLYTAYSKDDNAVGTFVQLSYFQASQLRESLLRMHAAYAVQLMYNGGQGFSFTGLDGSVSSTTTNPNVTNLQPGTVLSEGIVPMYLPAALLLAWACVEVVLGVFYGFRRRWADTVDEGLRTLKI